MSIKKSKNQQPKTGIPRILQLVTDKKSLLVLSGLLAALAAIASFVPFIATYQAVRQVLVVYPDFAALDAAALIRCGWLAILAVIVDVLCYFLASIFSHMAAFGTLYRLKVDFAAHITHIPLGWHLTLGSGRLRKIMDEDIEKIESFLAHQFPDLVASITAPVAMLAVMFFFDWRFGAVSLAAMLLAFIIQFSLMGKDREHLMQKLQNTQADMTAASVEYVRGMPVLKVFGQTETSFKRLYDAIKAYTKFMLEYTFKWENGTCAFNAIINNVYLLLIPVGILIGMNTQNYPAYALSFIFYLLFVPSISGVMSKIMYTSSSGMQVGEGVAAMDRILAIPALPLPANPQTPQGNELRFEKVSFSYGENAAAALQEVSFTAAAGAVTAIVGPSGGGKSTIAHLVPRFWDVSEGAITISGVDIRSIPQEELMRRVGFVFQDSFLFKQSVRDNIRMGRANMADTEIIAAAKAAQCHDFICRLPMGYDTIVGSAGVHFSGGERQRIAIARTIAQNAPILVLDEATAFADPENEHLIQQALETLMKGKTVIMIAHRLSTVQGAAHIVVMDKGRVVQQGTHNQLIAEGRLYHEMWNNYQKALGWKIEVGKETA